MDKITKYNEIDLELPGRKPCAYFCIISDQDSSLEFLSSLFFSTLFVRLTNYARRHGDNGRLPVKVNVCLDEFCNIGKILDFKKIISTVRSRGINCQVIIQSAAQLSDRYEKKKWEEIVGNCDTSLFLGCNDTMTAEYISGKCGMATIKTTNDSMPLTPLFSPVINSTKPYSQTRSNTQKALMLPDEVLRLPNNQCLVLLRGQKPLQLYKIIPDELPAFHKLTPVKISDFIPDCKKQENEKNSKLRKKSISEGPKEASVNKEKEKEKNSLIQELFEMPRQADNKAESSTGLALHYDNVAEKNKEESIHNGWINDNGEVFVIYTRKELSDCLNISEKRVTAAMHELGAIALIWERRCGRGFANQIYLANVRISDYDAKQSKGAPLDESPTCEELRTDDTACLDVEATEIYCTISNEPVGKPVDNSHDIVDKSTIMASSKPIDIQNTGQELSVGNFKNCQYSGFRTAVSSVQEPPKLPPNNKEKDLKPAYVNQSQSKSCPSVATEEIKTCTTDTDILDRLMQLAGADVLALLTDFKYLRDWHIKKYIMTRHHAKPEHIAIMLKQLRTMGKIMMKEGYIFLPGIDMHKLAITNAETHATEQKSIQCLVIMDFRVKIIIPQSEIWYDGESAPPDYVIKSMMGAKVDYVVTNVDRAGECAIASRCMALGYARNHFFKDRQKNELGRIQKCNVLVVGPSRIIAECNGFDLEMGRRDLSYTAIADLRTEYKPGQELNARLLKSDQGNSIVEVSVKAVNPNPFDGADKRHPAGSQRQAVISGTYAGGVFCTLSDNTNILCIYSPGYFEENFYIGDSVRIVITQFDYKNKLVYGRIWSKM